MQEWDGLRYVLAVARAGSLAGAAVALRVDATTIGRRVDQAEAQLGSPIFVRQRGAWRPTVIGARLVAAAEEVERAVLAAAQVVRELEATPAGRVHLTTVEAVATWLIAPLLPALNARWPRIELVLSTTPTVLDLGKGEADLAIRIGNPREPDLVARRLGGFTEVPFASRAWLDARALDPSELRTLEGAPLVVMPGAGHRADLAKAGGGAVVLRCPATSTLVEAVAQGLGVGMLPIRIAEREPRLVRLDGLGIRRDRHLWLLYREEVGRSPAVRAVVEALVAGLAE